ncbi:zeta toxin family protein [Bradyrhizobium sp.]
MPSLIIVAGPNGAGKTSFANKYFDIQKTDLRYLNADEIARDLARPRLAQGELNIRAGREMLRQIDGSVEAGVSLMFETTLASLTYARKIPNWRQRGYTVALIYLRLPNVEMSIVRVKRRVAHGGHDIPEGVIRQRFSRSFDYFEKYYKSIVDEWYVWDSLEGEFRHAGSWKD